MKKENKWILLHIIAALIFGAFLYYLISPDVYFVSLIDRNVGGGIHLSAAACRTLPIRMIRNYVPDMLWGYALLLSVHLTVGEPGHLKHSFWIAFIFAGLMEMTQLLPFITGTFDLLDIAAEAAAALAACCVINRNSKKYVSRRICYEK